MGSLLLLAVCAGLPAGFWPSSARANVYATNVKLHDATAPAPAQALLGTTPAVLVPGHTLQIDYVLNEDATAGVTVEVLAGSNTVRQIVLALGSPGTQRGTNSVLWDGTSDAGTNVPLGQYSLRLTAASAGYADWTQTSDDNNPGSYVFAPRGIAVDRNAHSPYYGRVWVANGQLGIDPTVPGNQLGVLKLNADGSPAEEGEFSDGGWAWTGNEFSPWKVEVSADDAVYVSDLSSNGLVLRFDQTLSTNSQLLVLRPDNWPTNAGTTAVLSGPFVTGAGTNTQLWMADTNRAGSVGLRRWTVGADGSLAANDLGSTIVAAGGGADLDVAPFDVAVDLSNRIYTIQDVVDSGSPSYRLFRFPAYAAGPAERVADWTIGNTNDSMRGAAGVAVDPTATYVAVAFRGAGSGVGRVGGAVRVFNAADGSPVTTQTPAPYHDQTDVAWDNAGNLYTCDNWDSVWRSFSPPGTNQATTVAVQPIVVGNANVPPVLAAIADRSVAAGTTLTITNAASDPDGDQLRFSLTAGAATGASVNATNGLFTWTPTAAQAGANHFTVAVTDNGLPPLTATQSFTVTVTTVVSNQAPVLGAPVRTNNLIQFTLLGQPGAAYVILASSDLASWTPVLTNQEPTAVRLITLPVVPGQRYFRAAVLQSSGGNTPPVLALITNRTITVGTTLTITNAASDPDGDQLTFRLANGAATGASLDATNGIFSWTPTAAQVGSTNFTVVVADNGQPSLSATQSFTVTVMTVVSNAAPALGAPVRAGNLVQFTLLGQPDATYVILASSNLVAWVPVLTNHEAAAARLITLPFVAGQQYFRAELLQAGSAVLPPVLSAPGWANGQVQFTLSGQADVAYVILSSTNLVAWVPVATNQAPAAVRSITLPTAGRRNFFRALAAP